MTPEMTGAAVLKFEQTDIFAMRMGVPAGGDYLAIGQSNDLTTNIWMIVEKSTGSVGLGTVAPDERLDMSDGNIILDNGQWIKFRQSNDVNRNIISFDGNDDTLIQTRLGSRINLGDADFPNVLVVEVTKKRGRQCRLI